jgi:hypothetical protein
MRINVCVLGLVLSGVEANVQECGPKAGPLVRVHLENFMTVPAAALARAKGIASGIFAGAGVRLEWKEGEPRKSSQTAGCTGLVDDVLGIQFEETAAARFPGDAMAYAVPGKAGICIHIFYNRVVAAHSRDLTPVLLGHVLAHELTHVLEGVARHSEDGLMKAHWSSSDYMQMSHHPLPFAEDDVQLLRAHFHLPASALSMGR